MNREDLEDDLIELGAASVDTKGGPMGLEDTERTYWFKAAGLTQD